MSLPSRGMWNSWDSFSGTLAAQPKVTEKRIASSTSGILREVTGR